jgi:hypothetical protein
VRISKPGEHGPRRGRAKRLDQFSPEKPERDGIEQEDSLAGERNASALGKEVQEFVYVEIGGAHQTSQAISQ